MNSFIVHVRPISVENEALLKLKKFLLPLKTCLKDHGDSFGRCRKKDLISMY